MSDVKKTMLSVDGNTAAALGSYNFTEVAAIYPITPSSPMADHVDVYASQGKKNFFGNVVKVCEMQSEAGASGALHGALQGGSLATTYTASQGLLLMIPNIYKWCGELLPAVMHVSARSLATRSLSIFGDHQDIYAIRQTGIAMLCSHSVQEVADLSPIAHLIAIEASYPMCHFFDGFRTSHEIQNVEFIDDKEWEKLLDRKAVEQFRARALNPHTHPVTRGGAENDDIYFQGREAQNEHFNKVIDIADKYFKKASELTGRTYAPFVYVGDPKATKVIIAMGSVTETALEVVNDLNKKGEHVGLVKVHLYRPFSAKHLVSVLPETCKEIAVLDRTKEMGAVGEPLYEDVVSALKLEGRDVKVIGGRYGLSSRDTQPKHIKSVYDFMLTGKEFHGFTVGINDDVTHLSIPVDEEYEIAHNYTSCLFYGLGSDGTVGANKSSVKIIGDATHQYAQAYFAYDSRKSGGVTRSHLRFGKEPIHSTYYVEHANFISCSLDTYVFRFDMLKNLKKGGTFLLNTDMDDEALIKSLPNRVKYQLATKGAKFYVIDANKIALEIGMGRHTNTILQSAFFYLNPQIMPYEEANKWMKKLAEKTYSRKGQEIVELNYKSIDKGTEGLREVKVDPEWAKLPFNRERHILGDEYFDTYVDHINNLDGYDIPVSKFTEFELLDGTMEENVTYKEKRSIADRVPEWNKDYCIQCNQCAFVCPHATIRPFLLTEDEINNGPEGLKDIVKPAVGGPQVKDYKFVIQVSPMNCVGCGLCVNECMANKTAKKLGNDHYALKMVEAKSQFDKEKFATYLYKNTEYKTNLFPLTTVKGVGFLMPYMEISGACAGCGETPYYRLLSQLFGKDLLIANATGCSSIYSGSTPLTPFVTDKNGNGVAWANSLFEDNAEYGYGMRLATNYKLMQIARILEAALNSETVEANLKETIKTYLANIKNKDEARKIVPTLVKEVKESKDEAIKEVLLFERDLVDKSVWIVGGDGWAYDIGYGGLDHVLASEDDVNVMCLDTEVYSNTGGQSSKSSQTGSIAQFTASGKKTRKKNLALMAMSYGTVYVAQIALGANPMKAIQAFKEAESYNGPSLIICYAPCINQGIKGGLVNSIATEKEAVECGYFTTFRYDPRKLEQGKPALELDCKEPDFTKFREFILKETRYSQLPKVNPEHYEELFIKSEQAAKDRWERIKKFGL
ncbi:MAG: pyruvate:ferredoxin (flavodoxin) oxidoreductase [bacterium]|nr:pyruvate:ferredoxin (flavodoxin) oxidoreductase [bacterium]MDY4979631.1 pyruvate:ferredoxin (flavodoxin) oxidoreductase [Candidatus Onthovivens sp.]